MIRRYGEIEIRLTEDPCPEYTWPPRWTAVAMRAGTWGTPGEVACQSTDADPDRACQWAFDGLAERLGLQTRWTDPLPGRDDLLIEMRKTADLLQELNPPDPVVRAQALAAYGGLLVALHNAKPGGAR